jgi:alpha-ketoglutarate-dependent 2,4-dichlorophenoxyacetate dioxygenase
MGATIGPVTESVVAEVSESDRSQPFSDAACRVVDDTCERSAVRILPDQTLRQAQHVACARRFGPIDRSMRVQMDDATPRVPAAIAAVSTLDSRGAILAREDRLRLCMLGTQRWHTDSACTPVPAQALLLSQRAMALTGGQTACADLRAAWDALPAAMQGQVEGLVAAHAIASARAKLGFAMSTRAQRVLPPVPQVLVRHHPASGRTRLSRAAHAGRILGMPEQAGTALLEALTAFATQRQCVDRHRWRVNDLVRWDNRCTLHRGRPCDDQRWTREAQRATVEDVAHALEQEGIRVQAIG